jgi:hypothetical protein
MEKVATSERSARLCVVKNRLRKALENAPEVRQLLQEWIDLRFQKESTCRKKQTACSNKFSSRPR